MVASTATSPRIDITTDRTMEMGQPCRTEEALTADDHLALGRISAAAAVGLSEEGEAPRLHGDLSSPCVPKEEESYINGGVSVASEDACEALEVDTLGIPYDENPEPGGVLPDAARSVGGVSGITAPSHYIPLNQVCVPAPALSVLNEEVISTNVVDREHPASDDDRRATARSSLRAGLAAQESGAFDSAAALFSLGRKQLGGDGWEVDGETMLKLCSEGAHASYTIDDFDTMNQLIDEVLGRDTSVQEKFRVYEVKILVEQGYGNHAEAIELGFDVRRKLGLPTLLNITREKVSILSILVGYARTCRALGNRTAEELANLPILTDERIIMGQRMLELIEISCFQVQPLMFPRIIFLMIRTTLKHGINASSCDALAGFGALLCGAFGKPRRGREMARAAELILEKPGMERMTSRIRYICEGLIHHWISPLRSTLDPLLEGCEEGLKFGEGQSAGINQCLHVAHRFHSGLPLCPDTLPDMIDQSVGLQNDSKSESGGTLKAGMFIVKVYLLVSKVLVGTSSDEGEVSTAFDSLLWAAKKMSNQTLRGHIYTGQLELKVFFGDFKSALELLIEAGDVRSGFFATFTGLRFTFLAALTYLKSAQSCDTRERRRWKKKGLKSLKLIRGWVKKENVNLEHSLLILDAELAVLERKRSAYIEDRYKSAIQTAKVNGFLQDQALSNELASLYFAGQGDVTRRGSYMKHAIDCYSEWGALAKVDQLT
mmetsp:Transcript_28908/g.68879  ORF Transcript_28908/g.68879 Transcript_28908/m.68879 type:complete len:719 (+) Transcript_28908:357-2513(+)